MSTQTPNQKCRAKRTLEKKKADNEKAKEGMRKKRAKDKLAAAALALLNPPPPVVQPPPPAPPPPRPVDPHETIIEPSNTTRGTQLRRVKRLAIGLGEIYGGDNFWLVDPVEIFTYLDKRYPNPDTRRSYLSAIVHFLRDSNEFQDSVIAEYRAKMHELILSLEVQIGENRKSDTDKKVWMEWKEIKSKQKNVKKWNNPLQQAVFGLYTALPPRHMEYNSLKMRAYNTDSFARYSSVENVLWVTKKNKTIKFISVSQYKGSGNKGVYVTAKSLQGSHGKLMPRILSAPLSKIIEGKDEGDYIFPEKYRSGSAFSILVADVFEKATGKRITISPLRKIWATHQARSNPTYNQKKALAWQMGTSVTMFDSTYNKTGDDVADFVEPEPKPQAGLMGIQEPTQQTTLDGYIK